MTLTTTGRSAVDEALRRAVERLDPATRSQTAYHLGWTDADGPASGGKGVRPALALLSARAAGAPEETGIPGAVAVELVHNFSLLHDDLIDGDAERRHRPTVWSVWGGPSAILTGDALLGLAMEVLLDSGSVEAARLLAEAVRELIRGQVRDVAFEGRTGVTVDDVLDMARGKTGALMSASAAIGAVLAGAPSTVVAALTEFGHELGIAFQLVDDILGIWGDPAVTGKPIHSDLRSGKNSLPIAYARAHGADLTPDPTRAAEAVAAAGGRDWAAAEARRRLTLAVGALDTTGIDPAARADLAALAESVVHRAA